MDKYIEDFESIFNTKMTEREIMILSYGFTNGLKSKKEDDNIVKLFCHRVGKENSLDFVNQIKITATALGLRYQIDMMQRNVGRQSDELEYRVLLKGNKRDIDKLCNVIF